VAKIKYLYRRKFEGPAFLRPKISSVYEEVRNASRVVLLELEEEIKSLLQPNVEIIQDSLRDWHDEVRHQLDGVMSAAGESTPSTIGISICSQKIINVSF